jgi:WD40 repeat protein/uncharacterized caspase-like protein
MRMFFARRVNIFILLAILAAAAAFETFRPETVLSQQIAERRYKPELVLQAGHVGPILSIAYSPDGKLIATGSEDATIKLWNVETGKELRTLIGHIGAVNGLAFSPDGNSIATAGSDFVTRIWDVRTGTLTKTLEGHWNYLNCVAFAPDGKSIVTGSEDQTVKLWNAATGELKFSDGPLRHYDPETVYKQEIVPEAVTSVAMNRAGSLIAAARNDKTVTVLSAQDGKRSKVLTSLASPARTLWFGNDGNSLFIATKEGVEVWDVEAGTQTPMALEGAKETKRSINTASISADRKFLATVDAANIRIWDLSNGHQRRTMPIAKGVAIRTLTFSPDNRSLALSETVNNKEYLVTIVNVEDGKDVRALEGHSNQLFTIDVSPDGKKIATAPEDGKIVKLWDLTGRSTVRSLVTDSGGIPTLRFSPDSTKLAVDSMENLEVWDVARSVRISKMLDDGLELDRAPRFMPDGKKIVATRSGVGLEVYDIESGAAVKRLQLPEDPLNPPISFAIDRSGKYVALGLNDGRVLLMDLKTNGVVDSGCSQKDGYLISSLEFSGDSHYLAASARPGSTMVCDVTTRQEMWNKDILDPNADTLHSYFSSFAFSPDSKLVAGIAEDSWIKVWNAHDGKLLYDLPGHNRNRFLRNSIRFSPDGKILYATDGGNRIRFWGMVTGKELASFVTSGDKDWAVVTPEGFFDASEGGRQLLHFIVSSQDGYETISLEQLKHYYVPGLLKRIVDGQPIDRSSDFSVTLFPTLDIEQARAGEPAIDIDLHDRGGGVGRVEIQVNGSEVFSDARIGHQSDAHFSAGIFTVDIPRERLRPGANTIDVIAWNAEGNVRGRPQSIGLDLAADGAVTRGAGYQTGVSKTNPSQINFYAIVSGVSDYAGGSLDLRYAAKDAEDMARALSIAARKYFCAEEIRAGKQCSRVHVRLLTTEADKVSRFTGLRDVPDVQRLDPVKANYTEVFADVAKEAGPEDVVLVYLSGHATSVTVDESVKETGFADTYLYATRDATSLDRTLMTNRAERERNTVSSIELGKWLSNIGADKKVLILDTCAAGAAQNDLVAQTRAVDALQVRSIDRLQARTGFYVLMGSAADAVSFEANEYRQGLLTYSLLEGMTLGTALRDGGFLDVEKWFSFSEDKVEDLATGIGGVQRPSFIKSDKSRSFDIGRLESTDTAQIPIARRVPLILQPELRENGKRTDRERLTEQLETQLIQQSLIVSRGPAAQINYVNAATAVNGLSPRGSYTVNGDMVTIELSLISDEKEIARVKVTATRAQIIGELVRKIIAAASRKK